jgi:hypothetical protein
MEKPARKIAVVGFHLRTSFAMVQRVSDSRYDNDRPQSRKTAAPTFTFSSGSKLLGGR